MDIEHLGTDALVGHGGGVRSDTKDLRGALKVVGGQEATKATSMCAPMRRSSWWYIEEQFQIVRDGFERRLDLGELDSELLEVLEV